MGIEVVRSRRASELGFRALFELPHPPEGTIVMLGAPPGELVEVPVELDVEDRTIEVSAFGGSFVLERTKLTSLGTTAAGYAAMFVRDGDSGGRFLEGLARELGLEPPAAGERGEVERVDVGVTAARAGSGVAIQIRTEHCDLRLEILGENPRAGVLAIAADDVERYGEDFATWWAANFREGRPARVTRAQDPTLASDTPLIASVTPIEGTDHVFGGETLFAMRDGELTVWTPPYTTPRTIAKLPDRAQLYPSPDGRWVVAEATIPRERDGSLTHGESRLLLISVEGASIDTLCVKDRMLVFGDTSETVHWSEDSRRFSFAARVCVRSEEGVASQLAYDVVDRAWVDVLERGFFVRGWEKDALALNQMEFVDGDVRYHPFLWTPGSGHPPAAFEPKPREEFRWGGVYAFDEDRDLRAIDRASGTWRYLAPRSAGSPRVVATHGRAIVFVNHAGQYLIGMAPDLPVLGTAKIAWSAVDPARTAIASARAGDEARAKRDRAAAAEVDEIIRLRAAGAAFEWGIQDPASALTAFAEAARLDPDWSDAHHHLADTYRDAKDFEGALRACTAWIERCPRDSNAHVSASIALQNLGRHDESLRAADRAIELAPEDASPYYQRACALARAGRPEEAIRSADRAVELDPGVMLEIARDEDLASARGLPGFARYEAALAIEHGSNLYRAGKPAEARDAFRKSARLVPSLEACQNWTILSVNLDEQEDALAATEAWIAFRPVSYAYELRCRILMALGREAEAAEIAERALREDRADDRALGPFAEAFARAGRDELCLEMLGRLVASDPEFARGLLEEHPALARLRERGALAALVTRTGP